MDNCSFVLCRYVENTVKLGVENEDSISGGSGVTEFP